MTSSLSLLQLGIRPASNKHPGGNEDSPGDRHILVGEDRLQAVLDRVHGAGKPVWPTCRNRVEFFSGKLAVRKIVVRRKCHLVYPVFDATGSSPQLRTRWRMHRLVAVTDVTWSHQAALPSLEHDPERVCSGFSKRSRSDKKIERDDDSKKSHSDHACVRRKINSPQGLAAIGKTPGPRGPGVLPWTSTRPS